MTVSDLASTYLEQRERDWNAFASSSSDLPDYWGWWEDYSAGWRIPIQFLQPLGSEYTQQFAKGRCIAHEKGGCALYDHSRWQDQPENLREPHRLDQIKRAEAITKMKERGRGIPPYAGAQSPDDVLLPIAEAAGHGVAEPMQPHAG